MISAIVLAAGLSSRMGQPKMILPWKDTTVIETVVSTLETTKVDEILIVSGAERGSIELLLQNRPVHFAFNPEYPNGEMLASVKVGLSNLDKQSQAALIVLGDQPQITQQVVDRVIEAYRTNRSKIVVPSYKMKRGHPWLVDRMLWSQILAIESPNTLRGFLERNRDMVEYIAAPDDSILRDLDTPQDYLKEKP